MKLPLEWLKDYVDISDVSVEDLKNKLFSCGFEVEEVIESGSKIHYIPAKSKQPIKQITDFIKILKNHKEYKK